MKKLRLLITKECNRNCEGCCNKEYDLDKLPICTSFEGYDEIILTGGEPMLYPEKVISLCYEILDETLDEKLEPKIYLYTTQINNDFIWDILGLIDGLTLTLHEQEDVWKFISFNNIICNIKLEDVLSLRLHVFEGLDVSMLDELDLRNWKVCKNIKWIKNCPLPKDEVFMRLGEI